MYDFILFCSSFLYQNRYIFISKSIIYFPANLQNITKEVIVREKVTKNVENKC
ncbi:hypothetical protein B4110_1786 [Parageobacillus toebii]|uniref:Uncharacterized protein n=1 Tax=Parageobacillus toebii TaxID=153151 RepID=A0A150N412_9BACL|nr:hypothetical protein B4110_1786 [Parageobacillus toebii]